jgi:hypothetical protein
MLKNLNLLTIKAVLFGLCTLTATSSARAEGAVDLNYCCDYFSHGFCMDLPRGSSIERTDPVGDFFVHRIIGLSDEHPEMKITIYEGNGPRVNGFSARSETQTRERLSVAASDAIDFYQVTRNEHAANFRSDLVASTGFEWPAYVHVSYNPANRYERDIYQAIVSNMSFDRSDEIVWDPGCELRQHEFDESRGSSWFVE